MSTATSLDVTVVDGIIADAGPIGEPTQVVDATGLTVIPGLVDLQVNGAAGLDITETPDRLWDVAAALPALRRHGLRADSHHQRRRDPATPRSQRWPPVRPRAGRAPFPSACTSRGR